VTGWPSAKPLYRDEKNVFSEYLKLCVCANVLVLQIVRERVETVEPSE